MEATTFIRVSCDRQDAFDRRKLIVGQLRLLVARAEQGLALDQRSVDNLVRLSREFAEAKDE
jgi:hypothetical protein